ncbi:MAG: hypothetical protein AABX11_04595 [Nanoarchaeota archaeon]
MKFNKRGAMELSMSTVVVLVLAMLMLGLGIVLIKSIFSVATASIDTIDSKVQAQLSSLFSDERQDVVVLLGPDKTAKVTAGTANFGIGVGARPLDASSSKTESIRFKITYETSNPKNCVGTLGASVVDSFFISPINRDLEPDQTDTNGAYYRIQLTIPKGTPTCTQKVYIDAKEPKGTIGRNSFTIQVLKPGLF